MRRCSTPPLAAIATGLLFLPFLTGAYSVVMVTLAHVG